jgi:ectoine hydroxylase-related dioxygenase (phytanoyl-CoA dioxygenase family)
MNAILRGSEICVNGLIVKVSESKFGTVQFHQDYTFVDPKVHRAANIWCPLIDVNEENGCLKVIPGSHRSLKCFGISTPLPSPFASVSQILNSKFAKSIPVRAGWAVFYDSRLIHGSDENRSSTKRVAFACARVPKYLSKDERRTALVFEVSTDFLCHYMPATKSEGVRMITSCEVDVSPMRAEDLDLLEHYQREALKMR